jgi:hypothetical protein
VFSGFTNVNLKIFIQIRLHTVRIAKNRVCEKAVKILKGLEFWAALSIIIATICLMIANKLRWIYFGFFVGPFRANHWFVLIGALYIAFAVPIIAVSKRRYPRKFRALLRVHVFGNLLAFLLISLHFAGQVTRPAEFYPQLGTGLGLYIIVMLLVVTGFTHRFQLIPRLKSQVRKFVHVGFTFSFYILIGIHILHGLGFL